MFPIVQQSFNMLNVQIKKYGSTSWIGNGQVQNGVLYLRYESSKINTAK